MEFQMKKNTAVLIFVSMFLCLQHPVQALSADAHTAGGGNQEVSASKQTADSNSIDDLNYLDDETPTPKVADPLSGWNRMMFHFNDKFYFWVMKPVAKGYKEVLPTPVRTGVGNFFHNLATPIRLVNCFLQGRMGNAASEACRFLYDTTFGVLGIMDPAKDYPHLNPPEQDFGLTLGRFGIGNGVYVVWPLLGPSTLRDSAGLGGDYFLAPLTYLQPEVYAWSLKAEEVVNHQSFHIGEYEELKNAAIDPYEAFKDAYIQYRDRKLNQ